jgi:hypothetical protein
VPFYSFADAGVCYFVAAKPGSVSCRCSSLARDLPLWLHGCYFLAARVYLSVDAALRWMPRQ